MKGLEEKLQKELYQWWQWKNPSFPKKAIFESVRNENNEGGLKAIIKGKIYNDMGRQAGSPDIKILCEGKTYCIELKQPNACITSKGKLTKSLGLSINQLRFHTLLQECGFHPIVIWSLSQFEIFVCDYIMQNKPLNFVEYEIIQTEGFDQVKGNILTFFP